MQIFFHGCTSGRAKFWSLLSQFVGHFAFFNSPHSLCLTALLCINSSSWLAITYGIVQYCFTSFPKPWAALFRDLVRFFFDLVACTYLLSSRVLRLVSQLNTILKMPDQPPLSYVDVTKEIIYLFINPAKKKERKKKRKIWRFWAPSLGFYWNAPLQDYHDVSPEGSLVVRWRHNQIF